MPETDDAVEVNHQYQNRAREKQGDRPSTPALIPPRLPEVVPDGWIQRF
jgi:hypothetical protein